MKSHLGNALFGVFDYAAYPAGMLLLAPLILHELGMERYGIWAMASAVWNTGAILASGFGDANIRAVAEARATGAWNQLVVTVRSALGIHLVLGTLIAAIGWTIAPWIARSAVASAPGMFSDCLWSLRIAALLVLLRAVETVCVSTQRAFARYGSAVQVSVTARMLSLLAAWLAPMIATSVRDVMLWTMLISAVALSMQLRQLHTLLRGATITPLFHPLETRKLAGFGIFTWIQSVAGLLFGQIDRLIAGVSFGAAAVTSYTLCVQLAQPIYGICAAGLHFIFPYLASHTATGQSTRNPVLRALAANLLLAGGMLAMLLIFGHSILRVWVGPHVAAEAASLLAPIAWSSALPAAAVSGSYALLAMNRPKSVTAFNIAGGVAMIAAIPILIPHFGIAGLAYARLMFGPAVLLAYIPLFILLRRDGRPSPSNRALQYEES
ncbi:MAG TPA: oligosaccharide flippase family protein [Terracidiphilus sp.]|jgi:O-antigen/teichoic acid export membrane protein